MFPQSTPLTIQGTVPYLCVLNYVSNLPHHVAGKATQFVLLRSYGTSPTAEPSMMLLSGLHRL